MLTKITVKNFKRFDDVEIDLGNPVVFIGPNNSGKSSALQALALWEVGAKRWIEKRGSKITPMQRPGVTINRRDLIAVPVPKANLLWHRMHTRDVRRDENDKTSTNNIRIDIIVEGVDKGESWTCGLEFDYANEESFYCRPLRISDGKNIERMSVPISVESIKLAYLPPMSGLAANEIRLDPGAVNVRIGEGRTAEVLRNLCYRIKEEYSEKWNILYYHINKLFGAEIIEPQYVPERGEVIMNYKENGVELDISSSGRGLQQTLLLLAYMFANPGAILLLDEPDAHLEILRQRQIYQLLTDVARENNNQIIAASHSEVLLNEAADRDVVVAFVGKPHRIDDRGSQLLKSLREIGFEHYYQAEQTGWVLYLEGSTDLAILRAFANILQHEEAIRVLQSPYVYYIGNQRVKAREHFRGLKEAVSSLMSISIYDNLSIKLESNEEHIELQWQRKEIECYFCYRETFIEYAKKTAVHDSPGPLFTEDLRIKRVTAMNESIDEVEEALSTLGQPSPWSTECKVSDNFIESVFKKYFNKLNMYNVMAKKNFHELVYYVPLHKIDNEVREKLNAIVFVSNIAEMKKQK